MTQAKSEQIYDRQPHTYDKITTGVVELVDDQLQQLRIYVRCPALGDYKEKPIDMLPQCLMGFSFIGETVYRDDGFGATDGGYCHGLVLPPKVGAIAIVACLDNDANKRVCLGFIAPENILRTFPNGRYIVQDEQVHGPMSGNEYDAMKQLDYYHLAFGNQSPTNYERMTRSVDRQSSKVPDNLEQILSDTLSDPKDIIKMKDGSSTPLNAGYQNDPNIPGSERRSATVYGLTTPMGNTWYMDDAVDNTKIKIRTPKGCQLILDDTNERIYVNTAEGNSWFEMDYDGNVDGFSHNLNWHAKNNINLTADNNINLTSKNTNIKTTEVLSTQSLKWSNNTTNYIFVSDTIDLTCNTSTSSIATSKLKGDEFDIKVSNVKFDTSGFNALSSGNILMTGAAIHLNGPAAPSVTVDDPLEHLRTRLTSRVPQHEPWPRRSFKDDDTDHTQFIIMDSNDVNIGKEDIANLSGRRRNAFWRR